MCVCVHVFMYYVLCWRVCVYVRTHVQYVQYMHSTCMHMSVWCVHVGGIHMYIHVHVILKIYVTQLVYMYMYKMYMYMYVYVYIHVHVHCIYLLLFPKQTVLSFFLFVSHFHIGLYVNNTPIYTL